MTSTEDAYVSLGYFLRLSLIKAERPHLKDRKVDKIVLKFLIQTVSSTARISRDHRT